MNETNKKKKNIFFQKAILFLGNMTPFSLKLYITEFLVN